MFSITHDPRTSVALAVLAALLGPSAHATPPSPAAAPSPAPAAVAVADDVPTDSLRLDDLDLDLRAPPLEERAAGRTGGQVRARWDGRLGDSRVSVQLRLLPREAFGIEEPDDVTSLGVGHMRESLEAAGKAFDALSSDWLEGRFGLTPYAHLVRGAEVELSGTLRKPVSDHFQLGFLIPSHGCAIEVACAPPLDEAGAKALRGYLSGAVRWSGPVRDAEWTDDECDERWNLHAPESAREDFKKPIRTKHYVILTNSSGGKLFAKKMEENYKKIRKVFPFDEVEGRRLMPVFLFRTNHEYYAFCEAVAGWSKGQAAASKGHAWKDYYATWYESPNDPVHIHEATHQIFANRLRLGGGGSWFQEGVADYMDSRPNDRNVVARHVEEGEATPLRDFIQLQSLLYSSGTDSRTGDRAHDHYTQAGLLIEFLRESRFGKDRFQDFVHAVGRVPRGDVAEIDAALRSVYGVDVDGLEAEFRAYCKKR